MFAGVVGRQVPAGVTKEQAITQLQAQGQDGLASVISGVDFVPGQGVDFGAVARVLAYRLASGRPACSSATGSYCKARGRLPEELLSRLARDSGRQLHRQVPVIGMKVSFVSWLCIIGPLPGLARQYPRLKPSEILMAARREASSPTGEVTAPPSPCGG